MGRYSKRANNAKYLFITAACSGCPATMMFSDLDWGLSMVGIVAVILVLVVVVVVLFTAIDAYAKDGSSEVTRTPEVAEPYQSLVPDSVLLAQLLPRQFVVVDLETTGLDSYADDIIEIGAIKYTIGETGHKAIQCLVKPTVKLPKRIVEITNITDEMLDADGIEISVALEKFKEFVGDLPLVTYNAEFDIGFLHSAAERCGTTITNRYTCALKLTRRAFPGMPSYKLTEVSKLMKLTDISQHRALGDAERTITVFCVSTLKHGKKVRWTKPAIV